MEEAVFFGGIFDISFEEETIHLRVDILDGDLESIKCTRLCDLDLFHEANGEIFEDDAFGCGEEGKDMTDEVAFVGGEILPVWKIGRESTSSAVQKEASAFLYISHICGYWIGNMQKRSGLEDSNGSS